MYLEMVKKIGLRELDSSCEDTPEVLSESPVGLACIPSVVKHFDDTLRTVHFL